MLGVLQSAAFRYDLIRSIGKGGMAEVFLAAQKSASGIHRLTVVKRILPQLVSNPTVTSMLLDEARIAAQLNHNNIVQVYELGKDGEQYFIAMEYVAGCDLATLARVERHRGGRVPLAIALRVICEAANGLDYAHRQRGVSGRQLDIVHRDVSPHNIICSREGGVKLTDFGIAKAVGKAMVTEVGVVKGKVHYMSPEQYTGEKVDHRSDVYSLGVVLYQLSTGKLPRVRDNEDVDMAKVIAEAVPHPTIHDPSYPKGLAKIVMKALARRKRDRYQRCADFRDDLIEFAKQHSLLSFSKDLANYVNTEVPETHDDMLPNSPDAPTYLPTDMPTGLSLAMHRSIDAEMDRGRGGHADAEMAPTTLDGRRLRRIGSRRASKRAQVEFGGDNFTEAIGRLDPVSPHLQEPYHQVADKDVNSRRRRQLLWLLGITLLVGILGMGVFLKACPHSSSNDDAPPQSPIIQNTRSQSTGSGQRDPTIRSPINSSTDSRNVDMGEPTYEIVPLDVGRGDEKLVAGKIQLSAVPTKVEIAVDGSVRCYDSPCTISGLPLGRELLVTVKGERSYSIWLQRVVLSEQEPELNLSAVLKLKRSTELEGKEPIDGVEIATSATSPQIVNSKPSNPSSKGTKRKHPKSTRRSSKGSKPGKTKKAATKKPKNPKSRGGHSVRVSKYKTDQAVVVIDVRPVWAQVKINGQAVGTTPMQRVLPPGKYKIELSNAKAGFHKTISVNLKKGTKTKITEKIPPSVSKES